MSPLLLLLSAGCLSLPEPDDTEALSELIPPGPDAEDSGETAEPDTATDEADPGPAWALVDEPAGAATTGALLVLAEGALWRLTSSADGETVSRLAEVSGSVRLNANDGVATLMTERGDSLSLLDAESGATLAALTFDGWAEDALWVCDRLWVANASTATVQVVDTSTGVAGHVDWAGVGAELLAEDGTLYASYWTGDGRGAPDEVAVLPCTTDPVLRTATLTLNESSSSALRDGVWGAASTVGYEGYDPFQVSLVELDVGTGEQRWSYRSDEDFLLSGYAALPGTLHVGRVLRYVWDPREVGEATVWAIASGGAEARRVADTDCHGLTLAPREDGHATLWCVDDGALSQITLVLQDDGTWAGAPARAVLDGVDDLVWTR